MLIKPRSGRQLKTQLWGQNPNNINGPCIDACAAKGYPIAGTQYNSECWCGPLMPMQQSNDTDCNHPCSANANETCGGNGYFHDGSYISVFNNGNGRSASSTTSDPGIIKSVGPYNYSACVTEATAGRALGDKAISTSDMTLDNCAGNCTGYQLFGIEFGDECESSFSSFGLVQILILDRLLRQLFRCRKCQGS
jgi:hypothetical protein